MKHLLKRLFFYMSWPGLVLYFAWGVRARVAVYDEAGRLLLVEGRLGSWYDNKGLGLPGGGLHSGESPAVGAAREVREELGLELREDELSPLGRAQVRDQGIRYTAYFFVARVSHPRPLQPQASEIVHAGWYSEQELLHVHFSADAVEALRLLATQQ